jgi:hypothetical protein
MLIPKNSLCLSIDVVSSAGYGPQGGLAIEPNRLLRDV